MRRTLSLAGPLAVAAGAYAVLVRPRMLRWGATEDEVHARSAADDIVPGGKRGSTMAITIDAPPSEIWPWLVQMGCDRAGWYSWDRLDNGGRPSAQSIHPEWQSISVGQRIASTPDGKHWFEVAAIEPERFLAFRACFGRDGAQYDCSSPRPDAFSDALWAFRLEPLPGDRTRVVVTTHGAIAMPRSSLFGKSAYYLFWEPAHSIMQRRQFTNLKRRAEQALLAHQRTIGRPKAAGSGDRSAVSPDYCRRTSSEPRFTTRALGSRR